MSVSQWFSSLNGTESPSEIAREPPPHQTDPIGIPRRKHSDSGVGSYSASPPRSSLISAASQHTKRVNREMRELYAGKKLTPDARLKTLNCTVGEHLLQKWMASQNLPGVTPLSGSPSRR